MCSVCNFCLLDALFSGIRLIALLGFISMIGFSYFCLLFFEVFEVLRTCPWCLSCRPGSSWYWCLGLWNCWSSTCILLFHLDCFTILEDFSICFYFTFWSSGFVSGVWEVIFMKSICYLPFLFLILVLKAVMFLGIHEIHLLLFTVLVVSVLLVLGHLSSDSFWFFWLLQVF